MSRSIFLGRHMTTAGNNQFEHVVDLTEVEFEKAASDIGTVALFAEADLFSYIRLEYSKFAETCRHVERLTGAEIAAMGRSSIGIAVRSDAMAVLAALGMHHEQVHLRARRRQPGENIPRIDSDAYDSSFSYRFCVRLRNYVLHRGVDLVRVEIDRVETESGPQSTLAVTTDRPDLLDTSHFQDSWSTVRAEIEDLESDTIDLIPIFAEAFEVAQALAGRARILLYPDIFDILQRLRNLYDEAVIADGFPAIFDITGGDPDDGSAEAGRLDIRYMYIEKNLLDSAAELLRASSAG